MRIFLLIVSTLWLLFFIIISYEMFVNTPRQIESDKLFIEKEINPSVNFVKCFKKENNRLPDSTEFYSWEHQGNISYITKKSQISEDDEVAFRDVKWANDFFAIVVWRGEWNEYYFSDGDRYDTNNYGWNSAILNLLFCLFIGLIPIGLWYWKYGITAHRFRRNDH